MKKRFSGFDLKIIGLVLMVFDHIYAFFISQYNIPVQFKWAGRIVAPLFIFMSVEGYYHTRDKKRYMLRLYIGYVLMYLGNNLIVKILPNPNIDVITNSMFGTLFILLVYLCIVDYIISAFNNKNIKKLILGIVFLITPLVLNLLIFILMPVLPLSIFRLLILFVPLPLFVEGGLAFIALGIIMYTTRHNQKLLSVSYIIFSLMILLLNGFSNLFTTNYQWMMIFATPFFLLYNGKKGKSSKYLFYIFYPLHIYILYTISSLIVS